MQLGNICPSFSEHKNKVPEVRGCFKTCSDAQNNKYLPHVLI